MKNCALELFLLLWLLIFVKSGHYYVKSSGDDSKNCQDIEQPCLTLNHVFSLVPAKNSCIIHIMDEISLLTPLDYTFQGSSMIITGEGYDGGIKMNKSMRLLGVESWHTNIRLENLKISSYESTFVAESEYLIQLPGVYDDLGGYVSNLIIDDFSVSVDEKQVENFTFVVARQFQNCSVQGNSFGSCKNCVMVKSQWLHDCQFAKNTDIDTLVLYKSSDNPMIIELCLFQDNSVTSNVIHGDQEVLFKDTRFERNVVSHGNVVSLVPEKPDSPSIISSCVFTGNSAVKILEIDAELVAAEQADYTIRDSDFVLNTGNAFSVKGKHLHVELDNVKIAENLVHSDYPIVAGISCENSPSVELVSKSRIFNNVFLPESGKNMSSDVICDRDIGQTKLICGIDLLEYCGRSDEFFVDAFVETDVYNCTSQRPCRQIERAISVADTHKVTNSEIILMGNGVVNLVDHSIERENYSLRSFKNYSENPVVNFNSEVENYMNEIEGVSFMGDASVYFTVHKVDRCTFYLLNFLELSVRDVCNECQFHNIIDLSLNGPMYTKAKVFDIFTQNEIIGRGGKYKTNKITFQDSVFEHIQSPSLMKMYSELPSPEYLFDGCKFSKNLFSDSMFCVNISQTSTQKHYVMTIQDTQFIENRVEKHQNPLFNVEIRESNQINLYFMRTLFRRNNAPLFAFKAESAEPETGVEMAMETSTVADNEGQVFHLDGYSISVALVETKIQDNRCPGHLPVLCGIQCIDSPRVGISETTIIRNNTISASQKNSNILCGSSHHTNEVCSMKWSEKNVKGIACQYYPDDYKNDLVKVLVPVLVVLFVIFVVVVGVFVVIIILILKKKKERKSGYLQINTTGTQ